MENIYTNVRVLMVNKSLQVIYLSSYSDLGITKLAARASYHNNSDNMGRCCLSRHLNGN